MFCLYFLLDLRRRRLWAVLVTLAAFWLTACGAPAAPTTSAATANPILTATATGELRTAPVSGALPAQAAQTAAIAATPTPNPSPTAVPPTATPTLRPATRAPVAISEPTEQPTAKPTTRPTAEAEAQPTLQAPAIPGTTLKDGTYFVDGKEVAHFTTMQIGTEPVTAGQTPEFKQGGVVVVTDADLMERLIAENNPRDEVDKGNFKIPLPFEPTEGMKMWQVDHGAGTAGPWSEIVLKNIPPDFLILQPFSPYTTVGGDNKEDSKIVAIMLPQIVSPTGWGEIAIKPRFADGTFTSSVQLNVMAEAEFGVVLATKIAAKTLPSRYGPASSQGAQVLLLVGTDYVQGQTIKLENILSLDDGMLIAAGKRQ